MNRSIRTAIALLGFGLSTAANAATYFVLAIVDINGQMISHDTVGSQSGMESSIFDKWGLTMDRNVSCCYDENRTLDGGFTPGYSGTYASYAPSFPLSTANASIPPYVRYLCGDYTNHVNYSTLWVHYIGQGDYGWSHAANSMGMDFETW